MKKFSIRSEIYEIDTFNEFMSVFNINERDLILINKFTYNDFIEKIDLKCKLVFYEDYSNGEPSDIMVTKIINDIRDFQIDRIIGIGGGSVLDTAKLLCVKDAESAEDIYDDKVKLIREKGLILIPTTCGTGCEMTCVSVIDRPKYKSKIGKRIECNFADQAVLIPELLSKIPYSVFAYSSIDSLIHAMEIYVNPNSGNFSKSFCIKAISMIINSYKYIAENGEESRFDVMKQLLLASSYSGVALSNDLCGAVHACAMHFGGEHHVTHGASNYQFLVPVFSVYSDLKPEGEIKELAKVIRQELGIDGGLKYTFEVLGELLNKIIARKRLRDYGIKIEDLQYYVDKVFETQQRLLVVSYTEMTKEQFITIYERAY